MPSLAGKRAHNPLHACVSTVARERRVFIHAKKEADEADVDLHELRLEISGDVDQQKQTQAENATRAGHLSSKKHKMDDQHATRLARLQDEASVRASATRAKYDGQRDVAKKNMREVNSRVASTDADHALQIRSAQSKLDKRQRKRVDAAKALKNNIGKKLAKIATKNFENQVEEKARLKREKAAHDGLLQEGINPYLHFRRKRLKEKTLIERDKTLNKIATKKMKIMNEMLDDDDFQRKRLGKQHEQEAYENIYRKSLGRREREKKVEEYLKRNTKDGEVGHPRIACINSR